MCLEPLPDRVAIQLCKAAGFDLNSTPPHPFRFGAWPWVLLLLGLIGIALSFRRDASLGDQPRRFIENLRGR